MKLNAALKRGSLLMVLGLGAGQVVANSWWWDPHRWDRDRCDRCDQPEKVSACYYFLFSDNTGGFPLAYDIVLALGLQPVGKITTPEQELGEFEGNPNPPQVGYTIAGKFLAKSRTGADVQWYPVSGSVVATAETGEANDGALMHITGARFDGGAAAWSGCTSTEPSATPETWTCGDLALQNFGSDVIKAESRSQDWTRVDTLDESTRAMAEELCGAFRVIPDAAP